MLNEFRLLKQVQMQEYLVCMSKDHGIPRQMVILERSFRSTQLKLPDQDLSLELRPKSALSKDPASGHENHGDKSLQ